MLPPRKVRKQEEQEAKIEEKSFAGEDENTVSPQEEMTKNHEASGSSSSGIAVTEPALGSTGSAELDEAARKEDAWWAQFFEDFWMPPAEFHAKKLMPLRERGWMENEEAWQKGDDEYRRRELAIRKKVAEKFAEYEKDRKERERRHPSGDPDPVP